MTPIRWIMLGLVVVIGALFYRNYKETKDYEKWVGDQFTLGFIGQAYRGYQTEHGEPPARIEDLKKVYPEKSGTYDLLTQGRYEIIWGTPMIEDRGSQPCDEVLGWSTITTYKGINVLMRDGRTTTMTADKLAAATKAKGIQ